MLKDNERCYFGVGWEYARQNKKKTDNPFSAIEEPYAHNQFKEGYLAYRESKTADYSLVENFDITKFPAKNNVLGD